MIFRQSFRLFPVAILSKILEIYLKGSRHIIVCEMFFAWFESRDSRAMMVQEWPASS